MTMALHYIREMYVHKTFLKKNRNFYAIPTVLRIAVRAYGIYERVYLFHFVSIVVLMFST